MLTYGIHIWEVRVDGTEAQSFQAVFFFNVNSVIACCRMVYFVPRNGHAFLLVCIYEPVLYAVSRSPFAAFVGTLVWLFLSAANARERDVSCCLCDALSDAAVPTPTLRVCMYVFLTIRGTYSLSCFFHSHEYVLKKATHELCVCCFFLKSRHFFFKSSACI